jgi:hypothetical protein
MSDTHDPTKTNHVEEVAAELNDLPGVHQVNDVIDHAEEVVGKKAKEVLGHLHRHKD